MNFQQALIASIDTGEIIARYFNGDPGAFMQGLRDLKRLKADVRAVEYSRWRTMIRRCYDSTAASWQYYGDKGIKVCDRWHDFDNFFADMGPVPAPGLSIDRKDGRGDYCPENCRWATASEQVANRTLGPRSAFGSVTFMKAEGKWRALARVKGKSASKRFNDRAEAVEWARVQSLELAV